MTCLQQRHHHLSAARVVTEEDLVPRLVRTQRLADQPWKMTWRTLWMNGGRRTKRTCLPCCVRTIQIPHRRRQDLRQDSQARPQRHQGPRATRGATPTKTAGMQATHLPTRTTQRRRPASLGQPCLLGYGGGSVGRADVGGHSRSTTPNGVQDRADTLHNALCTTTVATRAGHGRNHLTEWVA